MLLNRESMPELQLTNNKLQQKLKDMIFNDVLNWGEGLDPDNHVYDWVMDTKSILLEPEGLRIVTSLFMDKIKKYGPDAVGGLTLASHLITSNLVCECNKSNLNFSGFFVRKERKDYGMMKLIEGSLKERSKVVIIDDCIHAAGFATRAIEAVESIGCKVLAVIVLINFESDEEKDLRKKGYVIDSIFTLKDFGLDTRHEELQPDFYNLEWRYCTINSTDYSAPKSSPIAEDDKVYVGSDQGKLMTFDLSGKLLWECKSDPHLYGVHSSPIIVGNKVIFAGYDGSIYAADKNTGAIVWKNKGCSFIGATPIYDTGSNMIYIGLENETLKGSMAAINPENGNIIWEITTNNHVTSRPAIGKHNILVFGSNDCFIYACNKTNGQLLWRFCTQGENKGRLTIDEDFCYATSFDGYLYCIDLQGQLVWKKRLGTKLYNQPVIWKNQVVVGSYSKQITALDKKNGKILWCFATNGAILSYPTVYNGIVYFGSYDGCIYAVNAENGKLIWKFITSGPVTSSPLIYKDMLFVSSNDGYLYCFSKKE